MGRLQGYVPVVGLAMVGLFSTGCVAIYLGGETASSSPATETPSPAGSTPLPTTPATSPLSSPTPTAPPEPSPSGLPETSPQAPSPTEAPPPSPSATPAPTSEPEGEPSPTPTCPERSEVCGDGIDNDCDGVAEEGCLPVCDSSAMFPTIRVTDSEGDAEEHFEDGEAAHVTSTLLNLSPSTCRVVSEDLCLGTFEASGGGANPLPVAVWPSVCPATPLEVELAPATALVIEWVWDFSDISGDTVDSGWYEIVVRWEGGIEVGSEVEYEGDHD